MGGTVGTKLEIAFGSFVLPLFEIVFVIILTMDMVCSYFLEKKISIERNRTSYSVLGTTPLQCEYGIESEGTTLYVTQLHLLLQIIKARSYNIYIYYSFYIFICRLDFHKPYHWVG